MSEKCDRNHRSNSDAQTCYTVCETPLDNDNRAAVAADAAAEAVQTVERRESDFSEPVCINTNQVYDSCRDRDCVRDTRVYLTEADQELIENAINVKLKKAEIIWVYSNIEPLSFNNGYFSVDLKFFVCVTLQVFTGVCNPTKIRGLATFDKRVILFGSEGNSKIFKSSTEGCDIAANWRNTSLPEVVVETVDPVALSAKISDKHDCDCRCECKYECKCRRDPHDEQEHEHEHDYNKKKKPTPITPTCLFPEGICACFEGNLVTEDTDRQILVSFGLFFIVRLERDSQLSIDAVDFCIPSRECVSATENNPCELFNDIRFPIDEFFPPQKRTDDSDHECCGCGCN